MSFTSSKSTVVASPALSQISVASWSAVDNIYQQNLADATAAVLEVLNSNFNTWNFPSPNTNAFRSPSPILEVPRSPSPALDDPTFFPPVFIPAELQPAIPTLPTPPIWPALTFGNDSDVPASPKYIVTSTPVSPAPTNNLDLLAHIAAFEDDYRLDNQENLLPAPTQDSFVHQHLGFHPQAYIQTEDMPPEPLPEAIVNAPVATVPSPAPGPRSPTPGLLPVLHELTPLPLLLVPLADLFPNLFAAPVCTFVDDCHPHQYNIVYDRGEKFWVPQEEFIERDPLRNIPQIPTLGTYPLHFVTPFHADVFHNVWVKLDGSLPSVNLCAKLGRHLHSASFPFGYLESSFVDSIKFLFEQFPPNWLAHFEGALVPLVAYNFLDGRLATLCRQLHFTENGIFVINRNTHMEDLLHMQPELAAFVCTPRVLMNPFASITPPPIETPL